MGNKQYQGRIPAEGKGKRQMEPVGSRLPLTGTTERLEPIEPMKLKPREPLEELPPKDFNIGKRKNRHIKDVDGMSEFIKKSKGGRTW